MAGEITDDAMDDDVVLDENESITGKLETRLTADEEAARSAIARRAIERMRDSQALQDMLADDFDPLDYREVEAF